jgi:hypothetical protein
MSREKDLVIAKYITEPAHGGYLARIQIEFHRRDADNHSLATTPIRVHLRR